MHLSAVLNEGDAVVYQTGTWELDGVQLGDGSPPKIRLAKVDTLQIVWTHNCEHGYIRGLALELAETQSDFDNDDGDTKDDDDQRQRPKVIVSEPLEFVDIGPEQLLARLPVHWNQLNEDEGRLLVHLPSNLIPSLD